MTPWLPKSLPASSAATRAAVVLAVAGRFATDGIAPIAVAPSRLRGREGNVEIFLHARQGAPALPATDLQRQARDAAAIDADATRSGGQRVTAT